MTDTSLFIVDPSEEVRISIAAAAGDTEWTGHDSLAQLAQAIDAGHVPAVVLTGPGIVHDDTVMLATSILEEGIPAALIQVTKSLDPDALRSALRAGVADVVEVDGPDGEIRRAIDRAREQALRVVRRSGPATVQDSRPTPMVALVAGKGGVGTSFVAVNTAAALARLGHDVILVDLDVAGGDLAIMLQQRPALNVLDAMARIDHLDDDALGGYLVQVRKRLRLLAAPYDPEHQVDAATFTRLREVLDTAAEVLVVDVGSATTAAARDVLHRADHVVVVSNRELTSIRGSKVVLADLLASGRSRSTITVLANESDTATGLSISDVERAMDTDFDVRVPGDKRAPQSINRGEPIVDRRRSKTGAALLDFATTLAATLELPA